MSLAVIALEQLQASPEKFDDTDLVLGFGPCAEQLRLAAGEHVMAELWPAIEPPGERLDFL